MEDRSWGTVGPPTPGVFRGPYMRFTIYRRRSDGIIQRYHTNSRKRKQELENASYQEWQKQRKTFRDNRKSQRKTRKAPPPPIPKQAPPPPPRPPPSEPDFLTRPPKRFQTLFSGFGTMGGIEEMINPETGSPPILNENLDDPTYGLEFAAPAAFYTPDTLRQTKWDGIVEEESLLMQLNELLQFEGERTPDFDFRHVYRHWEYRYTIQEHVGSFWRTLKDVSVVNGRRKRHL